MVIPRNHQVEKALKAAEEGNYAPTKRLIERLKYPFKELANDPYILPPTPDERVYQTFCGT